MVLLTLITQKLNKKSKGKDEFSHIALIIINIYVVLSELGFHLTLGLSHKNSSIIFHISEIPVSILDEYILICVKI